MNKKIGILINAIAGVVTLGGSVLLYKCQKSKIEQEAIQNFKESLRPEIEKQQNNRKYWADKALELLEKEAEWDDPDAWKDEFDNAVSMQNGKSGEIFALMKITGDAKEVGTI